MILEVLLPVIFLVRPLRAVLQSIFQRCFRMLQKRTIIVVFQAALQGEPVNKDSFRLKASIVNLLLTAVTAGLLWQAHLCAAQTANNAFVAETANGQLRGVARPDGGAEFLGIPYAQPPVGELRWHEPLPAKPWSGVRDASAFDGACAQPLLRGDWNKHEATASKEDCLYLNVITPVWPAKTPLPVMLWIHGGANEGGSASNALYKDGTLIRHGVILVTINYRLGIFGFFSHPGLTAESAHHASGNYGLMDQILALRWVRENIARFGGDPKNITVFGQSAGAQDTGLLMTSTLSKGLFQRAIAQSGTSFSPRMPSLTEAETAGEEFAASQKAPAGSAAVKYLRQLSARELLAARESLNPQPVFGPSIDGWVIERSPAAVFQSGQEAAIPLLFGTTAREFGMDVNGTPTAPEQVRRIITNAAGSLAPQALAVYGLDHGGQGNSDPLYGSAADQAIADANFRCPATTQGAWHAAAHHPTYEYELAHAIPGHEAQGAVHSADLPYVFGFFPKNDGNIGGKFTATDLKLSDLMTSYWTNFAKTGNPNSAELPEWPQFDAERKYIRFAQDGQVVTSADLRSAACRVYREMLAERMKEGK
jgi:para-nitrobenzyl esterase